MQVTVSAQGFSVTPTIDAAVRSRLDDSLGKFSPSVLSVDVYLRDINGPKGGDDKTALFSIRLREGPTLTIESTRNDVYAAIGVSARRSKRAVRRALSKSRRVARRELRSLRQTQGHVEEPARVH